MGTTSKTFEIEETPQRLKTVFRLQEPDDYFIVLTVEEHTTTSHRPGAWKVKQVASITLNAYELALLGEFIKSHNPHQ